MPADVNEEISEWFEPKPEKPPRWSNEESPKGAWRAAFDGNWTHAASPSNQEGYPEPVYRWRAPNYSSDEAANARLLEAMPDVVVAHYGPVGWHVFKATHWFVGTTSIGQGEYLGIRSGPEVENIIYANDKDRKTAVLRAFCRFANIPLEDR